MLRVSGHVAEGSIFRTIAEIRCLMCLIGSMRWNCRFASVKAAINGCWSPVNKNWFHASVQKWSYNAHVGAHPYFLVNISFLMSKFITIVKVTNSKGGENSEKNSDLSSFFHFVHFKLAYKTQIKLSIFRIQQSIPINKIQNTKFVGIWIGFNCCCNCLLWWWKNF